MKSHIKVFLGSVLSWLIYSAVCLAVANSEGLELKVKTELSDTLSKVIPRESFLISVATHFETVTEKKITEGEVIVQQVTNSQPAVVPPLPGFEAPAVPSALPPSPQQNRQVYKNVDKEVLKTVAAQVTFDDGLDEKTLEQARALVSRYMVMNFGPLGKATFDVVKMIHPMRSKAWVSLWNEYAPFWIATIFILALAFWIFGMRPKAETARTYPTVSHPKEEWVTAEDEVPMSSSRARNSSSGAIPIPRSQVALPPGTGGDKNNFPALPATQAFAELRSELLDSFLKNAPIFRAYFEKLSEASQLELYAGLRGPAFDSLLEAMQLKIPKGAEGTQSPNEEQMQFYAKNFAEFVKMQGWQEEQFFGFLKNLSQEQLLGMVKQENPMISALMIQFLKPDQSAKILDAIDAKTRTNIFAQFGQIKNLSTEELNAIEETVRRRVDQLPKLLGNSNIKDVDFWSQVLSQSQSQTEILMDFEKVRPDLYPLLSKFRFQLDDVPSLPAPLISKVLDDVENDELALAMQSCSRDTVQFVLGKLNQSRRQLVASQILTLGGVPPETTNKAKLSLTTKFREVMV